MLIPIKKFYVIIKAYQQRSLVLIIDMPNQCIFMVFIYKKVCTGSVLFPHCCWKMYIITVILLADLVNFFHAFTRWTYDLIGLALIRLTKKKSKSRVKGLTLKKPQKRWY